MHSRSSVNQCGVPIVLVHGLVISSLYWIPLGECLANSREVHALDLPGFGRSRSSEPAMTVPQLGESILRWMDASGIQRCHLVANSLGCQIAAHVAVSAPDRLATLTMIGATIDSSAHRLSTEVRRLLRDAIHEPPRLWMDWMFDFARAGLSRAVRTTRHMFEDYIERQLSLISAPTLVIRGEFDPTMNPDWTREIVRLLPEAELHVIPQAQHCVHFTHPVLVAGTLLGWCRKMEDRQSDGASRGGAKNLKRRTVAWPPVDAES
jgi:2-hydroxy-6-oxonona-2,4-dienedioate hydrolase